MKMPSWISFHQLRSRTEFGAGGDAMGHGVCLISSFEGANTLGEKASNCLPPKCSPQVHYNTKNFFFSLTV